SRQFLSIDRDFGDAHCGEALPMSTELLVLLLAFVVKNQDLITAALLHHLTNHQRLRLRTADLSRFSGDREHIFEFNSPVVAVALTLHPNHVAGRHPVLLSSGADDRVHTYASIQSKSVATWRDPGNPQIFLCLLLSASAPEQRMRGRLQNGTASTGK